MEPLVSPYRMDDVCNQIPEALAGVKQLVVTETVTKSLRKTRMV